MIGFKTVFLLSLFVTALVSGYQGDSLEDLLNRVPNRLQDRSYEENRGTGHRISKRQSWDSYIDNLIAQSKDASGAAHVDRACIIGLDGGAPWTSNAHPNALKLSGSEGPNIAKVFKSGDFTPFMYGGVYAENTKYSFLREEDGKIVYARKSGHGALTLQKSKTTIVIAHCPEGSQQGNANKAVGVIAEHLESMNM